MTERPPDPALEERVVRALIASGDVRPGSPWRWMAPLATAAAVVFALVFIHPWTARAANPEEYVLLLYANPGYEWPPPGHLNDRIAEYARWADSLDRKGELRIAGRLEGTGDVDGMFIVRVRNQAEADSIAAVSPHVRYRGKVEVRRFIE